MASIEDFKKLDLKIARIKEVKEHPDADKLYVLTVEAGAENKQVVAGIKPFYSADDIRGKQVVLVNNLDPVTIRGVESQGMILASGSGDKMALITCDKEMPSGAGVR